MFIAFFKRTVEILKSAYIVSTPSSQHTSRPTSSFF